MAIHLHRSNRSESLVEMLCHVLGENLPADPFQPYPVVVGSRGMERWLRHEVATGMHIAAGLAFPFPREALAGAARWLLDGAKNDGPTNDRARFWEVDPQTRRAAQAWEREALAFRLVGLLRSHIDEPDFASVARYLAEGRDDLDAGAVSARELLFAEEVGDVLDRLMHDRPRDALAWAEDVDAADGRHRWLATLLADIGAATDPHSPAVLHRQLTSTPGRATGRSLCVFGLSTMGPGDRERLAAIARSIDVHLFVLVPTDRWFQYQRTRGEASSARRQASTDDERRQLETELASDNPILVSLGAPSRDNQLWLEEVGYLGDRVEALDPAIRDTDTVPSTPPSTLHQLQSWILAADGPDAVTEPLSNDRSISVHSAYGALRQCEVLRDELLAMFAGDSTLEPRDVVVMTPDIETYAPLVAAVFSRTGVAASADAYGDEVRLPRVPVSIADLGLRRTNPVAEVLLKTLEVAGERLTASWVLDFLALEPVRERWGLDDDDISDLRQLVRDSGLRWGMDAADRAAVDQPAIDQNTVRFALERLALGVLMPDEDALAVVTDPSGRLGPAVPLDVVSRERVQRVGGLVAVLRTLGAHRAAMIEPATLDSWRERMVAALDELAATTEELGWLRAEIDAALDDMSRVGSSLEGRLVERAAVLRWLQGRFEMAQRGDRAITGAVQVCALEPMRSVPFRVVALLGMDDKAFPRGARPRTWDPMEERRFGERDRREVDRHLMLEAILSARDRLLVLFTGHDVQQGKEQSAAVPVEELLETVGQLTACSREQLLRKHPLQPWSPGNFGAQPKSFDHGMASAARRLRQIETGELAARSLGLAASGTAALPPEAVLPDVLELDALAAALLNPHRLLLAGRLGLSVSYEEAALEDREPLELDALEAWSLRSRVLEHLLEVHEQEGDAPLVEALLERVAGEGLLPMRAGGRAVLAEEVQRATDVLANLGAVAGRRTDALELSVQVVGGPMLIGRAQHVLQRGEQLLLQWHTPSAGPNERDKLIAWVHLLAARASGHPVVGARIVGFGSRATDKAGGAFLAFHGTDDDARTALGRLVEVWRVARERPLPLFRKTSSATAAVLATRGDDLHAPGVRVRLVGQVAEAWRGGFRRRGDVEDPWIATFFVDYEPIDDLDDERDFSLIGLARRVWLPLERALAGGTELASGWRAAGSSRWAR